MQIYLYEHRYILRTSYNMMGIVHAAKGLSSICRSTVALAGAGSFFSPLFASLHTTALVLHWISSPGLPGASGPQPDSQNPSFSLLAWSTYSVDMTWKDCLTVFSPLDRLAGQWGSEKAFTCLGPYLHVHTEYVHTYLHTLCLSALDVLGILAVPSFSSLLFVIES